MAAVFVGQCKLHTEQLVTKVDNVRFISSEGIHPRQCPAVVYYSN